MSFTSPAIGEHGNTVKGHDYNLFWTKLSATIRWGGTGTVDNSPDVNLYLKRPTTDNAQGLYVPEATWVGYMNHVVCLDVTNSAVIQAFGTTANEFYRDTGGDVTVSGTADTIGTNMTLTVTANTTVQAVEMVVSDSDSAQEVYIYCEQELLMINEDTKSTLTGSYFPSAGTAALTTAE